LAKEVLEGKISKDMEITIDFKGGSLVFENQGSPTKTEAVEV
jgi:hypothetical protein